LILEERNARKAGKARKILDTGFWSLDTGKDRKARKLEKARKTKGQ